MTDTKKETRQRVAVAPYFKFFSPMLQVLKKLGDSGTRKEVVSEIISFMNISEQEQEETLKNGASRVENLIHWAEVYLSKGGLIDSSERGVLTLTDKGNDKDYSDQELLEIYLNVKRSFTQLGIEAKKKKVLVAEESDIVEEIIDIPEYKKELLNILKTVPPFGFEKLCQRLLRESGFEEVIVTRKTGDGGIDGHGTLQINPLMSFKVIFQCKRYDGSISSPQIRDFRGAMLGRADKGIFITTGRFTLDATKEANRDGVPPIELVDGERLIELFVKTQLGLKEKKVYEVDNTFFNEFFDK